jgi:hypothetical protein
MKLRLPPLPWIFGGMIALGTLFWGAKRLLPGQVKVKGTPLTLSQARTYLKSALQVELGRVPSATELKMLLAQSALETKDWTRMWNWSFGNIQVGSSGAKWFYLKHDDPSEDLNRYRAFNSPEEGAAYYVNFLHRRFPEAWAFISTGDTAAFSKALRVKTYFTGDPIQYARGMDAKMRYV